MNRSGALALTVAVLIAVAGLAVGVTSYTHAQDATHQAGRAAAAAQTATTAAAAAQHTAAATSQALAALCTPSRVSTWNTDTEDQQYQPFNEAEYEEYIDEVRLLDAICGTHFTPNGA